MLVLCRNHARIWKRRNPGREDAGIEAVLKICSDPKRSNGDVLLLRDWLKKYHPDAYQDDREGE